MQNTGLRSAADAAEAAVAAQMTDSASLLSASPLAAPSIPILAGGCKYRVFSLHEDGVCPTICIAGWMMKQGALFRRYFNCVAVTRYSQPTLIVFYFRWSRRFFVLNNHVLFCYADDAHSSGPAARPLSVRLRAFLFRRVPPHPWTQALVIRYAAGAGLQRFRPFRPSAGKSRRGEYASVHAGDGRQGDTLAATRNREAAVANFDCLVRWKEHDACLFQYLHVFACSSREDLLRWTAAFERYVKCRNVSHLNVCSSLRATFHFTFCA